MRNLIFISCVVFFIVSCGGGGSSPGNDNSAEISVEGVWTITENSKNDDCLLSTPTETFDLTVTQNGNNLTIIDDDGETFTGTLDAYSFSWNGSYSDPAPDGTPGRTTLDLMSANVDNSCNSLTGTANWTWTATDNSGYVCSGTTSFSGTRTPADGCGLVTGPVAPTGLNAVATSSGSIDLTWQDNADNEDAYVLERSEVSSTNGFSVIATLPADTQSYSDTGLAPVTTYYYRVAASNIEGQSGYSSVASATTDTAPVTVPSAPSGLNGSATSSTSVRLFWTDTSNNESSFNIYQATSPGGPFTLAQTVTANATNATIGGLSPATAYAFKVIAVNIAGSSADSNIHEVTTQTAAQTLPPAPSALTVGSATSSSLTLNWSDNSNNETGFRVYRSSSQSGTYSEIATTSGTTYTNTGLIASTTYWYRVSAFNNVGESAQTTASSGTTAAPPVTPPAAPSALTVGSATSSSLTLNWSDNSDNETGFRVIRSTSQSGVYLQVATTTSPTYTNTGLSASSTYWYIVVAYNSAGDSAQTAAVSGTTQPLSITIPSAPTNPVISNITSSSATFSWTDNAINETGFQLGNCTGLISFLSNGLRECLTGFAQFAQASANVTSMTITGLSANTLYTVFVRAYNTAGSSDNTGVSFTTAPPPDPCAPLPAESGFIQWTGSANGPLVVDAPVSDFFKFQTGTGYLQFGSTTYTNIWVNFNSDLIFNSVDIGGVFNIIATNGCKITGMISNSGFYLDIFGPESNLNIQLSSITPIFARVSASKLMDPEGRMPQYGVNVEGKEGYQSEAVIIDQTEAAIIENLPEGNQGILTFK